MKKSLICIVMMISFSALEAQERDVAKYISDYQKQITQMSIYFDSSLHYYETLKSGYLSGIEKEYLSTAKSFFDSAYVLLDSLEIRTSDFCIIEGFDFTRANHFNKNKSIAELIETEFEVGFAIMKDNFDNMYHQLQVSYNLVHSPDYPRYGRYRMRVDEIVIKQNTKDYLPHFAVLIEVLNEYAAQCSKKNE